MEGQGRVFCFRQEKRAQRLTFWVRRPPGGVGVFHAKGWWPKSSCPPSKVCLPWVSRRGTGTSQEFCRDIPDPWGCSESLCKKSSCAFFVPYRCQMMQVVSASSDRTIKIWALATGRCLATLEGHTDSVMDVQASVLHFHPESEGALVSQERVPKNLLRSLLSGYV